MKTRITKTTAAIISVLCAFSFILAMPIYAGNGLTDATVKSYEEQLADIAWKKQNAINELAQIRSSSSSAWEEYAKYDELMQYNNELKKLAESQLDVISEQITEKEALIEEASKNLETQEDAFMERMVNTYMDSSTDYLELILGSKDLVDFLTKADRINAIIKYDKELMTKLETSRETFERETKALAETKKTQELRIAELDQAVKENAEICDQKLSYIDQLKSDETKMIDEYTYFKQKEDELNAELENYLSELQRKSQSAYIGGELGWPLEWGVYYMVSSEYGYRTLWGMNDFHLGIDLACANGTNVYAANGGTVVKSEMHYSYGNYVLIDHGGGISTLYAHMADRLVSAGDTVAAGQQIGHVGLTGSTNGYHLHFEVRENGSTTEPRNYIVLP